MAVIKIGADKIAGELAARERQTPGEITKAMLRSARKAQALLVRRTPKDLGQAKAGWRVSKPIKGTRGAAVDVYNDNPYVGILERGARPHGVSLEGRMMIYEWVLRNIPATPAASGPVAPGKRRTHGLGRGGRPKKIKEDQAMEITNAIVQKIRKKGQKGTFFVLKSMDELNREFGGELQKQIDAYSRRRAKRKGKT